MGRFEELYHGLGMTWTRRAEWFIRASDGKDDRRPYSMSRPTAKQIDKWKERLSIADIESCRRFVEPFGLPYYPGFEPHVRTPA